MSKNLTVVTVLALTVLLLGAPLWAAASNPLAEAAYNARMAEGDKKTSAANAIKNAVLKDKTGNPAQAAYDARIKENNSLKPELRFDTKKKDNPADKIYQAVIKAQKKLADDATYMADKFSPDVLGTIERVLGKIPGVTAAKPAKNLEKIVNAYQIAKTYKLMVDKSKQHKTATGAVKDRLNYEIAYLNLDLIERVGGFGLILFQTKLLSAVIDGAKGVIAAQKYRVEEYDLLWYGLEDYMATQKGDKSEYRDLAVILMKNEVSVQDIDAVVAALEIVKKMK
jgi:hypothetical protein